MIRLLAIDMDGTCLNDKKLISEKTMEALKQAAAAGIAVVPTTGRTARCLPHQLAKESFYRYIISSNGACATDLVSGERLYEAAIPWQTALELLDQCAGAGLGISAHIQQEFLLQGHLLRLTGRLHYGRDAARTREVRDIAELIRREKTDVEELQLFHFTPSARERARSLLQDYDQLLQSHTDYYVELYSRQASKGAALAALADHLHIPQEEIACIGDAENDLAMFRSAGLKFAMGNAIPALKEQADTVLRSNNEDGVAQAVQEIILPQQH